MNIEPFGAFDQGEVGRVAISGGGLTAHVINRGAALQDLRLEGHDAPLVLGYRTIEDYIGYSPHFGAIPGRYANRIANGRFTLDAERYHVDQNENGRNMLHGGSKGFSKRLWTFAESGPDFVTLTLHSADGDMGFPGNLDAACTYRLKPGGVLSIELSATSDRPTLCNLTNHSYFNLDDGGASDVLRHRIVIDAGAYLPVNDEAIPTGVVQPVDGTPFDLRLASEIGATGTLYDHNFCLSASPGPLRRAAWAQGASSGVEMEAWTTEPGVQFYMGHKIKPDGPPGLTGKPYVPSSGFCLEAQVWPDSPNRPYFPQAVLRPGETYRAATEYRFKLG